MIGVPSKLSVIRKTADLARILTTWDLRGETNTERRKWKYPRSDCITHLNTHLTFFSFRNSEYCCARCPHPNHTPTHHTNAMGECVIQRWWPSHRHPSRHTKPKSSSGLRRRQSRFIWEYKREQVCLRCLLWIDKARVQDKTYIWVSVRWKTKNLKVRNLHDSHTLGSSGNWNT